MSPSKEARLDGWVTAALIVLVPVSAHLLFSSLGFNPTDDGYCLAWSRRILDGQIPHRDFIAVLPVLSAIIHLPFVLFGGPYTYWLSRLFVWFQLACIACVWTSLLNRSLQLSLSPLRRVFVTLISFAVSTHSFPIMAWPQIDGLFLIALGLAIYSTRKPSARVFGYIVLSMSYLCRHSFAFAPPLILLASGDGKRLRCWLAVALPGSLYFIFLLLSGALSGAITQLSSQSILFRVGFWAYLHRGGVFLGGIILGYFGMRLAYREPRIRAPSFEALKVFVGVVVLTLVPTLLFAGGLVAGRLETVETSFLAFAMVAGTVGYLLTEKPRDSPRYLRFGLLTLIVAWTTSLSYGYNFPLLVSGQLLAFLLGCAYSQVEKLLAKRVLTVALSAITLAVLAAFGIARLEYIYREQPARNLTKRLDGILPGGNLIRTNPNTYDFLVDLREAILAARDSGTSYAIIPECAGYWVKSDKTNPLPLDWVNAADRLIPSARRQEFEALEKGRGTNVVIVQKVEAGTLARGFDPIGRGKDPTVDYVRDSFRLIHETRFFQLYR